MKGIGRRKTGGGSECQSQHNQPDRGRTDENVYRDVYETGAAPGVDAELLIFGETSDSDKTDYARIRFLIGQLQRGEKEIVLQTMGTLA